jgi:hypothetical protein
MGGLLLFQDGEQGVDEAVERGGVDAFGVPDGIMDKGEMGAVNQSHAIEQEKTFHGEILNFKLQTPRWKFGAF